MAAIAKKGKGGNVYQMSGAGFHSPKGYSRSQRHSAREEIDERIAEMEQDADKHGAARETSDHWNEDF